jgi:hypothetical protein
LPRTILIQKGEHIGFILGWFTYNNYFHFKDGILHIENELNDIFFQTLNGRFLIVEKINSEIQVTTDPGSQLAAIYDEITKTVASTPTVLSYLRKIEMDTEVIRNVTRTDGTTWYPFGLVPCKGVKRILPSRRLQLDRGTCTAIRYLSNDLIIDNPDVITKEIFQRVTSNIVAISKAGPLTAHLTAGYDTRMILSSCLSCGVSVTFQTFMAENTGARLDCEVAKEIARMCNLEHKTILFQQPETKQIEQWMERAGWCIYDSVTLLCKTVKNSDSGQFQLTGGCGEVGRSFYWEKKDLTRNYIPTKELLKIVGFKYSQLLEDKCESWLSEISSGHLDKTTILDIAYIENRLGCWSGPSVYGHDISRPTLSPFNEA